MTQVFIHDSTHDPDPALGPDSQPPAGNDSTSALAPFANPVFRMLWLCSLAANVSLWMNDVAAAWLMTSLSASPVLVALVSSASTLPMFIFGLPSGALADILDRRRYLVATQVWVAGVAVLSSLALMSGAMNPTLLLVLTFANGAGLAMRLPVFAAVVPELVTRTQLPAALALNGVAMNASRIIGPTLAGAIIANVGIVWVFGLNVLIAITTGFAVTRWKHERKASPLPGERFVGAIRVGLQYVWQSHRMHVVLLRVSIFFIQSTGLIALLPLVARQLHGGGAGSFTLLLACMGLGAISSAFLMPRLRERLAPDKLLTYGTMLQALMSMVVAWAPNVWIAAPAMILCGMTWLSVANSLSVSAQIGLPDWVRARAMSIYQMSLMGSSALGAAFWGQVASLTAVRTSIMLAAAFGLVMLFVLRHVRLDSLTEEDLTPMRTWTPPIATGLVDPKAGPVLVTIEYLIDEERVGDFRAVMQRSKRSRLQHGALAWELFRDSTNPRRFLEYFIDETWIEHLRRFDRVTAADVALREQRLAFHTGDKPPVISRYIAESLDKID
jgi:MFS family permease